MKKQITLSLFVAIAIVGMTMSTEAQLLQGFGKKLEKKIEDKIERKADRQVDKVLDKADKKTDEPLNNALNKPKSKTTTAKEAKSKTQFEAVAARPDQAMVLVGGNCQDFSWFKKGAVLAYEAFDKNGKVEGGITMEVRNLTSKGSATIAEVDATMSSPQFDDMAYSMNYICDGDMLYMDIASMMKAMMEKNPEMKNQSVQEALKNVEMDFSNGFASFPKKMYPGMELDDLSFSFKTKAGSSEMSFQTVITDRQVIAKEKVTTKAGTFECLKVRSVSNATVQVMGFNQTMPPSTEYLWIAPGVGMIKQETHTEKEKGTSIQLKTYKNIFPDRNP